MSAGRQHLIIYPSPSVIQFMAIHCRMELVPKCGGKIPPTHRSTPFNEHSTIVMLAKRNKLKVPKSHQHTIYMSMSQYSERPLQIIEIKNSMTK